MPGDGRRNSSARKALGPLLAGSVGVAILLAVMTGAFLGYREIREDGYLESGLRRLYVDRLLEETLARWGIMSLVAVLSSCGLLTLASRLGRGGEGNSQGPGRLVGLLSHRATILASTLVLACGGVFVLLWQTPAAGSDQPNVVFIVVDTLRADHLGCYGDPGATTPNIDRLAQRSVVFDRAFSASSWTRPSIASLLSGRSPLRHGIFSECEEHVLGRGVPTIQRYLRDRGYETKAIVTNPHYEFGIQRDFESVESLPNGWADQVYDEAIAYVAREHERPYFLLIHNNDPHDAYEYHERFSTMPPESPYRKLKQLMPALQDGQGIRIDSERNRAGTAVLDDKALEEMKSNYDDEITFLDHHLGRFLEELEKSAGHSNTVVVFTADHGEEFLDHGSYWHGGTLYNELLRVPLIVSAPETEARRIDVRVSTMDVFPTLVEMLGGKNSDGRFGDCSRSLLTLLKGEGGVEAPIVAATAFRSRPKYSIILGRYKLIKDADERVELYDLEADPGERRNIGQEDPKTVARLEAELDRRIKEGEESVQERMRRAIEVDDDLRKRLEELGYVTGGEAGGQP